MANTPTKLPMHLPQANTHLTASVAPSAPHLGHRLGLRPAAQSHKYPHSSSFATRMHRHRVCNTRSWNVNPEVNCLGGILAPDCEKNFTFRKYSEMTGYSFLNADVSPMKKLIFLKNVKFC